MYWEDNTKVSSTNIKTIESSIHNNILHDCNRHRLNGYKDVTSYDSVGIEMIDEYGKRRKTD